MKTARLLFSILGAALLFGGLAQTTCYAGVHNLGQLTTPNVTSSVLSSVYNKHNIVFTVASISTNVVVRAEGSLDGVNYFNLDDTETDYTVNANGTYHLWTEKPTKYIRFRFVSESGGTTATLTTNYIGLSL